MNDKIKINDKVSYLEHPEYGTGKVINITEPVNKPGQKIFMVDFGTMYSWFDESQIRKVSND